MNVLPPRPGPLAIRKYANRRFYDTSRSCNVTQNELHQLICDGYDISVTDASTGEDITNVVLTHIILEHHSAKLAVFPAGVLQQIIRTQQQFLGGVMEQFFRQIVESQVATQQQWSQFMQRTFGVPGMPQTPFQAFPWLRPPTSAAAPQPAPATRNPETPDEASELNDLREKIAALSSQIERLSSK